MSVRISSERNVVPIDGATALREQRERREHTIEGMCSIIRRMTRVAPRGDLVVADYDERELSIKLLAYIEARDCEVDP